MLGGRKIIFFVFFFFFQAEDGIRDVERSRGLGDVYKRQVHGVVSEFLSSFEMHHRLCSPDSEDTRISRDEFFQYYNKISATIERDTYFDQLLSNSWKLGIKANAEKQPYAGVSSKIFQVNSKSQWNYDHHRTMFSSDHPLKSAEESSEYGHSVQGKSIYEKSASIYSSEEKPKKYRGEDKKVSHSDIGLLKIVREKLQARGARGMVGIRRKFAIIDDDSSGFLEAGEFSKAMKELRLGLSPSEVERVFQVFDVNHDGRISYQEFLRIVIGEMNEARTAVVDTVFAKLDKTGDGVITVDDIKGIYSADRHPDVLSKRKTEGEVLSEFLDTFEQHYGILHPDSRDRIVTKEEFREYYTNISASIDDDKYFELMMMNAWNLSSLAPYPKAWASDY
eukprot:TRINITY_DN2570_c0_g1_i1.p1 TRINITY_DN2570_c0_g1~~TRINITY_DN2570_c0_g1_i1.p1  ORF type:complete len:393 (+),score=80.92 TRINITY_DN2570_c0_g1_i1:77-1255(+)